MTSNDVKPIVIDNGSHTIKAGYAGENNPRTIVPTVVAQSLNALGHTDWYVGEHARLLKTRLPLSFPISNGAVTNVDELAVIWHYLYSKELRVNSSEHPLLLIEYPQMPQEQRKVLVEMAFEKFSVPALYCSNQSVLSLYSAGLTTGLAVDIGHDRMSIVPVRETYMLQDAIRQRELGGSHVTKYLQRLLVSNNPSVSRFITPEVTQYFKEKLCYVSVNPVAELNPIFGVKPVKFEAPDGNVVSIGSERCLAPELFFNPTQGGLEGLGLTQCIQNVVDTCPPELRRFLYGNIVLSGGSTLFPGLPQRIERDLFQLAPQKTPVAVCPSDQRRYAVWIGGSILASLNTFSQIWVSKAEYEERGVQVVFEKCP